MVYIYIPHENGEFGDGLMIVLTCLNHRKPQITISLCLSVEVRGCQPRKTPGSLTPGREAAAQAVSII